MKKLVHELYLEAFSYPTEDDSKVFQAIFKVLGEEKPIKAERVESYYGPTILKLVYKANNYSEIKKILKHILKNMSEKNKRALLKEVKERLDEKGDFYLRFDKQEAYRGDLVLSYKGDVIKLVLSILSFPFSLKECEKNVREIFDKGVDL